MIHSLRPPTPYSSDKSVSLWRAFDLATVLAERGNEPSELIPASSLSAMIWGGRGWHVILRAERYTAAVAWMAYSAEYRIVAKKKKSRRFDTLF